MTHSPRRLFLLAALATTSALAQDMVLRDLDAQHRVTLSKDELTQLLPGARMGKLSSKGNTHLWTNDASGSFVVSTNNLGKSGQPSSAQGKWHISDDGRYCVLLEWKHSATEEWCRYIVKAGGAYYATKSDQTGTEKVYKLEIAK